jgi:hypothetical protein
VTSLSHLQSSLWTDYIGYINHAAYFVSSSASPAFLNSRSEKHKSTAPTAIYSTYCDLHQLLQSTTPTAIYSTYCNPSEKLLVLK